MLNNSTCCLIQTSDNCGIANNIIGYGNSCDKLNAELMEINNKEGNCAIPSKTNTDI